MKHYIVTNRKIITKDGREYITEDGYLFPSTELRFAVYDTEKPKNERIEVLPDGKVDLTGLIDYSEETGGSSQFFNEIYEKMSKSINSKDLLVFIHGFGGNNNRVENNIQKLHEHYVANGQDGDRNIDTILVFSWTTNGNFLSIPEYKRDSYDSYFAGVAFSRFYIKLLRFFKYFFNEQDNDPCQKNVHLMCHSMGNQVLQHMITALHESNNFSHNYNHRYPLIELFKEVILVAPDVPEDIFNKGEEFSYLTKLCQRIHVYTHKNDVGLGISEQLNGIGRLGNAKAEELPIIKDVYYVNSRKLTKGGWQGLKDEVIQHWYHYESKKVREDINQVLSGKNSDYIDPEKYEQDLDLIV